MKHFILFLGALAMLSMSSLAQNCTLPSNLQDGLVGYWPFCGNANDESGNGNDGVVNGATLTEDRFGNAGSAFVFDGNDVITLSNSNVLSAVNNASELTVSFWATDDGGSGERSILSSYALPTGGLYLVNGYYGSNEFGVAISPTSSVFNTPVSSPETFHHFVVSYNGSATAPNERLKVFVDGVESAISYPYTVPSQLGAGASSLFFGARHSIDLQPIDNWNGLLDDIGIWNRALTPAEITSLYTGEPVVQPVCSELAPELQNGLVGYWPFCGNANDESGNGLNGQLVYDNLPTLTTDRFGNANSAYSVATAGNGIILPAPTAGTFASGEMSYSIWYNEVVSNDFMHIFSAAGKPLLLGPNSSGISAYDGNSFYVGALSPDLSVAGWKNIVTVYQQDTITIFINGIEVVSETTGFDSPIPYFDAECLLGLTSGGMYPFLGQIDDAVLWNRALTAEEVANYYGSTSPPTTCAASIMQGDTTLCSGTSLTLSVALSSNDANSGEGITDVDGNFYPTIGIGDRTWMQKNLDVSHYRNGDVIPQVTDFNEWALLTTGAWCWYNNDSATYAATYGKIYNWYAVNDPRGLAPEGYEIPSNSDFGMLTAFIDPSANAGCYSCNFSETAGGALKEAGTTNWSDNSGASNSSQFTALPGGVRNETEFLYQSYLARFWSSTEAGGEDAYLMSLSYDAAYAASNVFHKNWGHSVRCIKSNNVSYTWSTGDTTAAISVSPIESATYYCTITDQLGNICSDSVHITVNSCATECPTLNPALQNGLVGYWPFCGNANDESGNGNDGVVNGATLTEDRFGNVESAFAFANSIELDTTDIQIPITNILMQNDFTLSTWSKLNSWTSTYPVIAEGDNGTFELGYAQSVDPPVTYFYYEEFLQSGDSYGDVNAPTNWSQWQHTVVVNNNQRTYLYINGQLVSTSDSLIIPPAQQVSEFIRLGRGYVSDLNAFNGLIDDVGFWNRALTEEEIALLYGNFTPQVTGCTDPLAFNYNPEANVNEGCLYTASVFVYNDLNGNGEHESNEPGLSNWPVVGNDINGLLWTNGNGNAFVAVPQGAYQFTVLNTTDNWVLTTEASGILSVGSNNCTDQAGNPIPCPNTTLSFGLQVIPGEAIVAAGPFTGFWDILHCTDGYESGVYLENIGSQTVSGFMTLTCDPLFTPNASSYFTTPPAETGPGYALWNIDDFLPGEYELLSYFVPGPGVEYLNAVFNFSLELTLLDPQGNIIFDETWDASPIVACAYDPNDLTGYPEGLDSPHDEGYTQQHFILDEHLVQFQARFQNTGTLPAEDVKVVILIDTTEWDISTIHPLHRTAEAQINCLHDDATLFSIYNIVLPSGVDLTDKIVLVYDFQDINLPDSASDSYGSNGSLTFAIRAKDTLNEGDELYAQAFIYFDSNPPITTNETYHVIFDCNSFTPMVGQSIYCEDEMMSFTATQPYVDGYMWALNNTDVGTGEQFSYPATLGNSDDGSVEYLLELITSNALCPLDMYDTEAEVHQVFGVINPTPSLNQNTYDTFCAGDEVAFNAQSNGTVYWSNGIANGSNITATESFVADVYALSNAGCSSATLSWEVTVNPLPSAEVDTNNNVLTAVDGIAWQWSVNGAEDVTTQSITASVSGNYQVEITNEFGCATTSELFVITDVSFVHSWPNLTAYPNPMRDLARIELPQGTFDVALYDITGACVRMMQQQQGITTIERESLASGVYQVRIVQGEQSKSLRLVIE